MKIAVGGGAELEDGRNRDRYEKGIVMTLACSHL